MSKNLFRLALCAMLFALCVSAEAQQQSKKVPRIGYLSAVDPATESARAETIRLALGELGYMEGQTIAIEYRYGEAKPARAPKIAAELVRLKVDIIVVAGGGGWVEAAKNATKTIPIVMVGPGIDPSRQGSLKALPVPAAMSPVLLSLTESYTASVWSCSRKPFQRLTVSRFSTIRPIGAVYAM